MTGETRPVKKSSALSVLFTLALLVVGIVLVGRMGPPQAAQYLALGAMLFAAGCLGVLLRRNALVMFMSIELMLNAVNLTLITFARVHGTLDGQILAFFVIIVAAAEVVVGLAIIVSIARRKETASVDEMRTLRW